VKGRDLVLLLLLAAMWGGAYTLMKVAVVEVSPAFLAAARLLFAVVVLLAALPLLTRQTTYGAGAFGLRDALGRWRSFLVLGAANAAIPYFAAAWGTQFLPSGVAAILNATVPLFTALLCVGLPWFPEERLDRGGLLGVALGIVGVGVLMGGGAAFAGGAGVREALLGAGAVLAGALGYAVGGLYARRSMAGVPVGFSAAGQNVAALLIVLPFALFALPREPLTPEALGAVAVLGVVGTGIAMLVFFRLIARVGATRTATVAYLVPVAALFYGAIFLGEPITAGAIAGLVLILAGVTGVSGLVVLLCRFQRAPPTP